MRHLIPAALVPVVAGCGAFALFDGDPRDTADRGFDPRTVPAACIGPAVDPRRAACVMVTEFGGREPPVTEDFDGCGRLVRRTIHRVEHDRRTLFSYDGSGRLDRVEHVDQGPRVEEYHYGLAGRLEWLDLWEGDALTGGETWTYDRLNPLLVTRWSWHEPGRAGWESYTHDAAGQVAWVVEGYNGAATGVTHQTWDERGRLAATVERGLWFTRQTTFTWDDDRLATCTQDYDGTGSGPQTTVYGYDALGRLLSRDVFDESRHRVRSESSWSTWSCDDRGPG